MRKLLWIIYFFSILSGLSEAQNFTKITSGQIVTDGGASRAVCWIDIDQDGFLDLYVSNSAGNRKNFLYRNNTGNLFLRVNDGNITNDGFYSRGVTWIDYDGDGDQDMFVVNENEQKNNLYKNMLKETGMATFSKVTIGELVNDLASSMSASWGDYDNDGDPDVFIANGYPYAQNDNLYKNNGDGTFTKITEGPIVNSGAFSIGSAWGDFDNDGDLDLFVTTAFAGSPSINILYKNKLMETDTVRFERILSGEIANDSGYAYGCA